MMPGQQLAVGGVDIEGGQGEADSLFGSHDDHSTYGVLCVFVCVRVCVCVCVCVSESLAPTMMVAPIMSAPMVCACVCLCVSVRVYVFVCMCCA